MNQELLMRVNLLNREHEELSEKLNFVENQINEMKDFNLAIDELEKNEKKDFLSPLGKGVFVKAEIKDSEYFVDVGSGVVVRKSPEKTREVVKKQILKLENMKMEINLRITELSGEIENIISEIEKSNN